jgi:hypothetical protein
MRFFSRFRVGSVENRYKNILKLSGIDQMVAHAKMELRLLGFTDLSKREVEARKAQIQLFLGEVDRIKNTAKFALSRVHTTHMEQQAIFELYALGQALLQ